MSDYSHVRENIRNFRKRSKLRVKNVLLLLVFFIVLVFSAIPFLPEIDFWINENIDVVKGEAGKKTSGSVLSESLLQRDGNYLYIPKIKVDAEIIEGESEEILEQGIWMRPNSATPIEGGNTVLTAHRFLYTSGPKTFYHLDKLLKGDEILISWKGEIFKYVVEDKFDVEATDLWIEENTRRDIVTLYTCSFDGEDRIVVRAVLQ